MWKFLIKRLIDSIPVLIGVAIIAFSLVHLSGDPVLLMLPADASPEQVEQFRHRMGYDRPILNQFLDFSVNLLTLNLGNSIRYQEPVTGLILERFWATLKLAWASLLIALVLGIPGGILSALHRGTAKDYLVSVIVFFGQAVPPFWLGLMMILVFAVSLKLLPSSGMGTLKQLIMPSLTVGLYFTASIARLTRSGILEIMGSDYIRTARAKGLAEKIVVYKHALRNCLIPIVTITGLQFGALLGGAVVTETIFAWPGIGRLMIQALYNRDYPLVQGTMLFFALIFIVMNLLVDILYCWIDPRIRYK
jgi:ABC-type dipeptide/oligopeptide/nickel transport system permease component